MSSGNTLSRLFGQSPFTALQAHRLNTYAREMEVVEILEGVFIIARRIARTQLNTVPAK